MQHVDIFFDMATTLLKQSSIFKLSTNNFIVLLKLLEHFHKTGAFEELYRSSDQKRL